LEAVAGPGGPDYASRLSRYQRSLEANDDYADDDYADDATDDTSQQYANG
jgi:hypothetical protein